MEHPRSEQPFRKGRAAASADAAAPLGGSGPGGPRGQHQDDQGACTHKRRAPVRSTPVFAVLHVADFALQAILRTTPELAHQPVALLANERKRAVVVALTPTARAHGVEPGLTAPQAQARCASLRLLTPQPAAEAEARAALLAAAWTLSPLIEATAPGVATADVNALPAARREPALRDALARLDALGLPASAGLASTPLLALYAARAVGTEGAAHGHGHGGGGRRGRCGEPHETACGFKGEQLGARICVVTDPRGFLAPLPIETAEPPEEVADILAAWGLRTLGDLVALPKSDIVRRLGPAGLALWERAAGETTRPLDPVTPPRTFDAAMELENPIETLEPLLFLLRRFLDRLTLELRAAGLVAAALQLVLPLDDGREHTRAFRLPEPTSDPEILFRALHSHLETVHTTSPVVGVRLVLEPARPLARQHGLFDTGLRDPHGFAETLARTVALMGSGRVGTPRCADTHRPDAVTLLPPAPVIPPAAPLEPLPPLGLALRRFRPPLPARVELSGGTATPAYVFTDTIHGPVAQVRGPWRGSGDWWQPDAAWEREEWDIALAGGGLYRVARTSDGWWLEGEYD